MSDGTVYLVGAGPGAADLITVRGAELIGSAEVLVYDYLVNEELLDLAPASAELIFVGKRGGAEPLFEQSEINRILVERAKAGKRVIRLKGGDPFIFGRGGEEAAALAQAGVDFEVVPGVTSAIAVPAFAGIPLTHREHGSFVAFITGHEDEGKTTSGVVPWDELARAARGRGTLVLLMAIGRLDEHIERLIEAGLAPVTPAAAIQHGCGAEQRTVAAELAALPSEVRRVGLSAPAVVVIGECARLRESLQWFERRPLFGKRIVITRRRGTSARFASTLRSRGAEVIEFPTIETAPPDDYSALDRAISELGAFDWVVFTSAEGVQRFVARIGALGRDVRQLSKAKTAAIGPGTAAQLRAFGLFVAALPTRFRAEAIIEAIGSAEIRGRSFLIPRAQLARNAIVDLLHEHGAARVEVAAAYKTVRPSAARTERIRKLLKESAVDIVAFTSSSTVTNFCEMIAPMPEGLKAAAIGPITGETARRLGFDVVVIPNEYTVEALASAVAEYLVSNR